MMRNTKTAWPWCKSKDTYVANADSQALTLVRCVSRPVQPSGESMYDGTELVDPVDANRVAQASALAIILTEMLNLGISDSREIAFRSLVDS